MPYRSIIIAALQTAGLFIAGLVVPLLGQIAALFVPVPLVTTSLLHGRKAGALTAVIAAVLAAVIGGGQVPVLLLFLSLLLMALGLSEGMRRDIKPEYAVLVAAVLPFIPLTVIALPVLAKTGKNPIMLAEGYLRQHLVEATQLYTRLGLVDVAQTIASLSDSIVLYVSRLMPGIILSTSLMQAATCYGMSRAIILRRQPHSPLATSPSFALWHAPDAWVWGLIATLGVIAASPRNSGAWFVGINAAILFLLVYIIQGMAIVEYYQRKARIPAIWRSFLHTLILTLPTIVAVIAFGVVDIWGDFRKVRTTPHTPQRN